MSHVMMQTQIMEMDVAIPVRSMDLQKVSVIWEVQSTMQTHEEMELFQMERYVSIQLRLM